MLKIIAFACLLFANFCSALKIGDQAPNYLGRDPQGNKIYLSDLKGKVVVVSFWASWCSYCLKELPILERIQLKAQDQVKVVAINYKESRKQYRFIRAC